MMISFNVVKVVVTAIVDHPVDVESLPLIFQHKVVYDAETYRGRLPTLSQILFEER